MKVDVATPDRADVHPGARQVPVLRCHDGERRAEPDWVAEEVPVALVFNGISHAVMLTTPADLEDFGRGFAWTEGLLDRPEDCLDVEIEPVNEGPATGLNVHLEVTAACEWRLRERRRSLTGRTGCGLCGTDSLDMVRQTLTPVTPVSVSPAAIARAHRDLQAHQTLQAQTGATHAAAWCDLEGGVRLVREDVGRHNALDKLIGALLREGYDARSGFFAITSRASFEMVQKTLRAGVAALTAVSAPTTMAIDLAERHGLLLAGFVRGRNLVAYAGTAALRSLPGIDLPPAGVRPDGA